MAKKKLPNVKEMSTDKLVARLNDVTRSFNKTVEDVEKLQEDNGQLRSDVDRQEKAIDNLMRSDTKQYQKLKSMEAFVEESKRFQNDTIKQNNAAEKRISVLEKKASLVTNALAKNASRVKETQQTQKVSSNDKTTFALVSSLNIVATSLGLINNTLSKMIAGKAVGAEQIAAPQAAATPTTPPGVKPEKEEGIFGLLKNLFTNPAVVAALAGIVYTVLPKEKQEQIKAFLGGFADGLSEAMGKNENEGLQGFNTVLKTAGIALTTYFGAKMISGIASAITTTLKIVRMIGGGKLGKGAAILGAGAAVGGAAVMMGGKKEGEGEAEGAPEEMGAAPAAAEPEAKPAPAGTGLKPSGGGVGLKPGGGPPGIKVPEMTGEDKPVMEMIKRHEGVRTRPYKDSLGLWTVGVGHLIGDGKSLPPEYNREFSMQEVDALFAKDYKHHKEAAEKIPGYGKLNPAGKAALTDLTFNMGPAWYKKWPNFTKSIAAGDMEGAARSLEDSKWYGQVGNRAKTIVAMIRGGGKEGGTLMDSSGQPVMSGSGEAVTTGSNVGSELNMASQEVKHAQRPQAATNVASVDNSSKGTTKQQGQPVQAPIPSPIASRGSLGAFTRHNTAYA